MSLEAPAQGGIRRERSEDAVGLSAAGAGSGAKHGDKVLPSFFSKKASAFACCHICLSACVRTVRRHENA